MVLFSLTFQIFLIFLGNRRKYSNKLWIRIVVWSAYITADSIATFALGILSNNLTELYNKDPDVAGSSPSLDANTHLSAFWAPLLVLHLGGPDTITTYALEDNELWLRHLIGLFVQIGMALSVFLMSCTVSSLSILSLVMFLPGIIKYGERTWAPLLYTRRGLVLRLITFVLTCSVMVLFPVLVDKHKYSKYKNHPILKTLTSAGSSEKRWSNNMSQYTLVSFTANKAKTEMQTAKFLDTTRVMGNYWHCEVSDDLRKLIFMYVEEKAEDPETSRRNKRRPPFTEFPSTLQDFVSDQFHLKCKMIKSVSRYMMYLLVEWPSMLSAKNSDRINFRRIRKMVEQRILSRSRETNYIDRFDKKFKAKACESLLEMSRDSHHDFGIDINSDLIYYAVKLVNEVNGKYSQTQSLQSKWKVIESDWMDLLGYAAKKCKGNEHAQQLRCGGELLTHVWLHLCHFGLTDHYEI
ncbi:hypothetical protein Q3G72_012506 [Acer saccharum]|nr:hypothetical protein Q3G72_012506 [Acer saccharum]